MDVAARTSWTSFKHGWNSEAEVNPQPQGAVDRAKSLAQRGLHKMGQFGQTVSDSLDALEGDEEAEIRVVTSVANTWRNPFFTCRQGMAEGVANLVRYGNQMNELVAFRQTNSPLSYFGRACKLTVNHITFNLGHALAWTVIAVALRGAPFLGNGLNGVTFGVVATLGTVVGLLGKKNAVTKHLPMPVKKVAAQLERWSGEARYYANRSLPILGGAAAAIGLYAILVGAKVIPQNVLNVMKPITAIMTVGIAIPAGHYLGSEVEWKRGA